MFLSQALKLYTIFISTMECKEVEEINSSPGGWLQYNS